MSRCNRDLIIPLLPVDQGRSGISYIQGACLSINYVIGTGVFTLPLAFIRSGTVYGTILLIVSAFCSYVALTYITETVSRCEAIRRQSTAENDKIADYSLSSRPWHYASMAALLLSNRFNKIVQLMLVIFCYGALWSFTSVFSSSFASLFFELVFNEPCDIYRQPSDSCSNGYHLSLILYGLIVITLSLLDLKEQIFIQVGLTIYRFVAFAIMLSTVLYSMFFAPPDWAAGDTGPPYISSVSKWDWSGYAILTSSAVALAMHINFPDIIQALEHREPTRIRRMTASVYVIVTCLYLVLGLICALFFGDRSEPLITLNWRNYTGPSFGNGIPSRYALILRTLVVAFPILDMLSVFPLAALTLSSNLRKTYLSVLEGRLLDKKLTTFSRLLSAIPPLIFGALAHDLESIFAVVGLTAFFLEFFVPCCLAIYARRQCSLRFSDDCTTPFATIYSGPIVTGSVIIFAVVCTGLSLSGMLMK